MRFSTAFGTSPASAKLAAPSAGAAAEAVQAADGGDDELMTEACSTGGATGGACDALPRTSPRKGGGVHARQSQPGTPNLPPQRSRHDGVGGGRELFD